MPMKGFCAIICRGGGGSSKKWSWRDSNPLPLDCQSSTLPIELQPRNSRYNLAQNRAVINSKERLTAEIPQIQIDITSDHLTSLVGRFFRLHPALLTV